MEQPEVIRVALADDHPVFRDSVRQLLSLEPGFEIVGEVGDGEDVYPLLRDNRPDILLLDLSMPCLDGQTTLLRLRSDDTTTTKIIVLTASEDPQQHVRAIGYGASAVVLKQMATLELTESIRRVHRGEVWLNSGTTAALMNAVRRDAQSDGPKLTARQREVVALVAQGHTNSQIADALFLSEQTVKNHLYQINEKLGLSGRVELAHYAIEHDLAKN